MLRIVELDFRGFLLAGASAVLLLAASGNVYSSIPEAIPPEAEQNYSPDSPAVDNRVLPGWVVPAADRVSPEESLQVLGSGDDTWGNRTPATRAAFALPGDYAALAEALENDPLRIFRYVRNHFEYAPYFGLLKGPYLTLHERSGNDFDQAALLVELLRAADIPARFQFGIMSASGAGDIQLVADWLGTDADPEIIANTFAQGGVPVALSGSSVRFNHVWVEATIGQRTVLLDPAFKPSTQYSAINLANAMNYSEGGVLEASGGISTGLSIKAMDSAGLSAYLAERATDLQNYLKLHHPNDRVEEVMGGYRIVPYEGTSLPDGLALPVSGTPISWEAVPENYIHTLQITQGGIDIRRNIPDIAGRKVSLSFADTNVSFPPPPAGAADFGSLLAGAEGPTLVWSGTNGTGGVIRVQATLSGSNASAFEMTSGGGSQMISDGEPFSIFVKFSGTGQSAGRKNAWLSLSYSNQGGHIGDERFALTGVVESERVARLYIDDELEAEESVASGDRNTLRLVIDHPYASDDGTYADQSRDFDVKRTGVYVIVSAFGGDKHSTLLSERQRLLNRMSVDGTAPDAPERQSETLNVIGQTWMQQTQLNSDLLHTLSGKRSIRHHRFGIAGQEEGYFVDMAAQLESVVDRVATPKPGTFKAQVFVASAMEHSVLDQLQGVYEDGSLTNPAVSTIRLFARTNSLGDRLFVATGNNYDSIYPQLRNYSSEMLDQFRTLTDASHTLVLPEDGAIAVKAWSGHGYVDYRADGAERVMGMIIGGGLNGGKGSIPGSASTQSVMQEYLPEQVLRENVPITPAGDPVDLGTGAFVSSLTDFAVEGAGTRGFQFTRSYNSQMASEDVAGLGRGWTHNYNIFISRHSDIEAGLGVRTLFDVIPMMVTNEIARRLLQSDSPAPRQWGVAALVADWGMEQLLNKSVTVQMGPRAMTFQEMPDGRFIAPAGETAELVRTGETYRLQERFDTVWKFNADDRIESITDADGMAMSFVYDSAGKLVQVKDAYSRSLFLEYQNDSLIRAHDSVGHSASYHQDDGNLIEVDGLEGSHWAYGYDSLQRMLTVVNPVGVQIVDNTYSDFDRVVEQRAPRDVGLVTYKMHYGGVFSAEEDPEGGRTTYHFDLEGRRVAVEDAMGHIARVVYDGQGHAVQSIDPLGNLSAAVYDANSNLLEERDARGHKVVHTYDAGHHRVKTRDPLGHETEFEYDAKHHLISQTDELGNTVQSTYFPNGLVDRVVDPRATQTRNSYDSYGYPSSARTGSHPQVKWKYSKRGDLETFTDQNGAITRFTHDQRGLVKSRKDSLGRVSRRDYTAVGKLQNKTDRLNRVTSFSYTNSGKLDVIQTPHSQVDFNYDSRDNLVEMIDSIGATTNTYDAAGRLTSHTDGNGHTVKYGYDAAGNLVTLIYPPGNKRVSYTYDNLNRISTVSIDWLTGKPTMRYIYDDASRVDRVEHFNAMETDYTWDVANRLTGINHGGATNLVEYSFLLDANGNRVRETVSPEPLIVGEQALEDTSFSYNLQRNRLKKTSTHSYTYDSEGQLTGTLDTVRSHYSYDNEGQLAGRDTVAYTFDDAHRLVQRGGDSFIYDGVGNRLKAIRNGAESQYIYDASGNLLARANSSGQITRYYIYGAGLIAMAAGGTYYVYHFDGTGHTVALTNASNEVVNTYAYSPYGMVLNEDQSVNQPFKYAGQAGIFTEDDNLYYMRARYYDAEVGRFISEDPAGFVDGSNLYAYVGGNPVSKVDPTGQFAFLVPGLLGGLANVAATAAFGDTDAGSLGVAFVTGAVGAYIPGGAAALATRHSAKAALKVSGGAFAGGSANVAGQVVNNFQAGRPFDELDITQVGIAAAGGILGTASILRAGTRTPEVVSAGILSSKFSLAAGAANRIVSGK